MPGQITYGRKRPLPPCPNPLFLKWLTEWRDAAADKGKKTQFVYQKAISSLKKYPLPLCNGKEAKILQNVGDGICKMLDERLEKHYAEHGPDAPIHSLPSSSETSSRASAQPGAAPPSLSCVSSLSIPPAVEAQQPEGRNPGTSPSKKQKTEGKKQREYVPQKQSGGYAVLLTLYRNTKSPSARGYMSKAELQREAQPLCDKTFTLTDPGSKYTAWSSVSTLIQKDLVIKTHSPARYSLTEKGLELAQRLEGAEQKVASREEGAMQGVGLCPEEEETERMGHNKLTPTILVHPAEGLRYQTLTLSDTRRDPWPAPSRTYHHVPDFTLRPGQFNVLLCVDFIETTGGSAHRKQELVSELKRNGVSFDVRKLHVGDFLWVAQEKVQPVPGQLRVPQARELVLDYVVERKRMDDLCGSIIDGRFREQKFRMKRCGLRHPIYLVEDHGSVQHLSIPETTLQQAIVNTQVVDGFFIKRTKDVRESAAYLTIMSRYLQGMYSNKTLLSCTKEEEEKCERSLTRQAQSCVLMEFKEFNEGAMKNKAQTVREVFARQLMQISGVSGEKAAAILERHSTPARKNGIFTSRGTFLSCDPMVVPACPPRVSMRFPFTPLSLLSAYERCVSTEDQEKMLSSVKCGKLHRNLGPVLSRTVSQLYCTKGALS
ncbi:structure-specific endonuclease subunit MUS81 isoform X2 [Ascaphus truei]|uniref:structure-specific endonuclease subunit MUS81 isoform X2 n=1 Tax=Ascaphus truei TaxID=8439 RepID=UPI003F59BF02